MKSYTLIIMKPDALERELVETIIQRFLDDDFNIEIIGFKQVDQKLILDHYAHVVEKLGESFKKIVIADFVGQSMLPVILSQSGTDAIVNSRILTGLTDPSLSPPGTIRGDYGVDSMTAADHEGRSCNNLIHCSDSQESFLTEIKLWFNTATYEHFALLGES